MKSRKKRDGKLYVCVAVIALVFCAAGGMFLLKKEPSEQNKPNQRQNAEKAEETEKAEGTEKSEPNPYEEFTPLDGENPTLGFALEEKDLVLEQVGCYTGPYVEDGSDLQVEQVAAVIIRNTSDKMLQLLQLELMIDGQEALFQISNLPAGAQVLAMEMNRISVSEESRIEYNQEASVFLEDASLHEDILEVSGKDGRLTVGNRTEESLKNVYVYYKTKRDEDSYLGGITYRVGFEEIPARTSIEEEAGHFKESSSRILDIRIRDT